MSRQLCLLTALIITLPQNGFAFNAAGHKIIAEIAWQKLDSDQRREIVAILRKHPRFDEDFQNKMPQQIVNQDAAAQDHWIFCQAAIWPDIVRGISQPAQGKYHRPRWHYINLPVFLDGEQADAFVGNLVANVEFALPTGGDEKLLNGVQAVKNSLNIVNSPTVDESDKAVHFCWLIHVIPDLAQPLHSAALFTEELFPAGDKGGNSVKIRREGSSGGGQSLHSVWDGLLGKNSDFNAVLSAANQFIANHGTEFNTAFVAMPNDVWATESQALAIQSAYGPILGKIQDAEGNGDPLGVIEVPESYFAEGGKVVQKQAVIAGVRLAGVLAGTVPRDDGPVPFAIGRPGIEFPAVIAMRSRVHSPRTEATADNASGHIEGRGELAKRLERLEAAVQRIEGLLRGNGAASHGVPRSASLATRAAAAAAHDDGEQCDCGMEE